MINKRVVSVIAIGLYLAAVLIISGCHKSETTTAGRPQESPMLRRIKQSRAGGAASGQHANP